MKYFTLASVLAFATIQTLAAAPVRRAAVASGPAGPIDPLYNTGAAGRRATYQYRNDVVDPADRVEFRANHHDEIQDARINARTNVVDPSDRVEFRANHHDEIQDARIDSRTDLVDPRDRAEFRYDARH